MGASDLHDYTFQADVRGAKKNGKMPEIGLIGQRYTISLMGTSQQLQLRSWVAEVARRETITKPFRWDVNAWYTIKLRTEVDGDKALVRGKVWARGEEEPKEWTIEMTDESPNRVGSPGFFGNAQESEICIDNISITPNE